MERERVEREAEEALETVRRAEEEERRRREFASRIGQASGPTAKLASDDLRQFEHGLPPPTPWDPPPSLQDEVSQLFDVLSSSPSSVGVPVATKGPVPAPRPAVAGGAPRPPAPTYPQPPPAPSVSYNDPPVPGSPALPTTYYRPPAPPPVPPAPAMPYPVHGFREVSPGPSNGGGRAPLAATTPPLPYSPAVYPPPDDAAARARTNSATNVLPYPAHTDSAFVHPGVLPNRSGPVSARPPVPAPRPGPPAYVPLGGAVDGRPPAVRTVLRRRLLILEWAADRCKVPVVVGWLLCMPGASQQAA